MQVLLIGGGGREAALAWRIARSDSLTKLFVTHPNPGWPGVAEFAPASTLEAQVTLAAELGVDLVVVGPEGPLSKGIADALQDLGIPCFGPSVGAARLEFSKAFTKEICAEAGIATARALVIDRTDPTAVARAQARLDQGRVVIKADGLAAGKGVLVCPTASEAHEGFASMSQFGAAADRVLLEDLLEGPEVSVFALTDGTRVVGLPSSQDHKQLLNGGQGPNTGGMGAYAPCPWLDRQGVDALMGSVFQPVVDALKERGTPYRGVLYGGFMLTADGPQLLEFNVRFGDPECQALMMLWEEDVLPWLAGAAKGQLPEGEPRFAAGASCCVVLASGGYPASSDKGVAIPEPEDEVPSVVTFQAGTRRDDEGVLRTHGGRVLGITAIGPDVATARERAYARIDAWRFEGAHYRTDIGATGVSS